MEHQDRQLGLSKTRSIALEPLSSPAKHCPQSDMQQLSARIS
jgi:hypothetical protein